MGNNDLQLKLELIRSLKAEKAELEAQIEALTDSVKAEMQSQGVNKIAFGTCSASWTKYTSNRFDTEKFKVEHKAMYEKYVRPVEMSRFLVK